MNWRYFPFKYYDIYERISLNDVVLDYVKKTQNGVISFTGWDSNCVNIGYSQKIKEVVDLEKCEECGIKLVRRKSSGGVTFLSRFDLSWGITVPENFFEGKDLQQIYMFATNKIISALKVLGIEAKHKPINDVVTSKGKISGSALRKDKGVIQLHGTLLFKVEKEILNSILRPENDHQKTQKIKEKDKRVTSISEFVNVDFEKVKDVFEKEFLKDLNYFEEEFSDLELELAKEKSQDLSSENWLYKF